MADYLGAGQPERDEHPYSYTGDELPPNARVNYQWTHGLGEIVTAFAEQGLAIERLDEYDWLSWQALPQMVQANDGRWRLPEGSPRLPLSYAILARRRA